MNKQNLALIILVPFSLLTLYTLWQVGYMGIFDHLLMNSAGWQVFMDLVIALVLVLSWIVPELKRSGRSPLPWIALTLLLGSFGPLLYLAFYRKKVLASEAVPVH